MDSQLLANIIISVSWITLVGVSFSLIFSCAGFLHFTHGIFFTIAPYLTFFLTIRGIPLLFSIPLALFVTSLLGCLTETIIYRPLRNKVSSPLILLLASLGVYIVLQNLISMFFGDNTKTLRSSNIIEGVSIFGAKVTIVQLVTIFLTIGLLLTVWLLLRNTKLGRAVRAVSNDRQLSDISGIDSNHVISWTFAIGSGLAGVAGILVALDIDMTPTMGMTPLMLGIVAVIIGGVGNIVGVFFGALLLAFTQQLGVWWLGSQWQDVTAFIILLVFLLFRPQGFLGRMISDKSI